MSRPLRLISRAVLAVVLVVAGLVTYRAYSRPHTTTDWDMAQASLAVGDRNTAVVHLRNVVRDNPNHGEAYLAVSKLHLDHAELNGLPATYAENERAFTFLAQAGKLLPQNVAVQQQLLAIYLDRGKIPEATEAAGRIAERLPKDPDVVTIRAHHLINQFDRAAAELNKVLNSKQSAYFQAMELRIKIDVATENETHLQKMFDEAVDRAGAEPIRNVALLSRREHLAMANLIRRGITQAPDATTAERRTRGALDAYDRLARVEAGGERHGEVIAQAADEATWLSLEYANKFGNQLHRETTVQFDEKAEAVRQFAVTANHIHTPTRLISVRQAYERGDVQRAAETAAQGIETAPTRGEALELRRIAGRLFIAARSPEADKHIQALTSDPEWSGYGRLLAGEKALASGKPQDALSYFRGALPLLGHTREVRAGLADAFIALGCWNEARAELSGLSRRANAEGAEKPAMGEPPHRALLLQLIQSSPEVGDVDLANALIGS